MFHARVVSLSATIAIQKLEDVLERGLSCRTKIFYFAGSTRSHFSASVTVDFPSRCNYGIIASEDISHRYDCPFTPTVYIPRFLIRIASIAFITGYLLYARECVYVFRPSSPRLNTFSVSFWEDIPLLISRQNRERDIYIKLLSSSFF